MLISFDYICSLGFADHMTAIVCKIGGKWVVLKYCSEFLADQATRKGFTTQSVPSFTHPPTHSYSTLQSYSTKLIWINHHRSVRCAKLLLTVPDIYFFKFSNLYNLYDEFVLWLPECRVNGNDCQSGEVFLRKNMHLFIISSRSQELSGIIFALSVCLCFLCALCCLCAP